MRRLCRDGLRSRRPSSSLDIQREFSDDQNVGDDRGGRTCPSGIPDRFVRSKRCGGSGGSRCRQRSVGRHRQRGGAPNGGSAGAGTAGVSGVPSGPANTGGLNNSGNDPSGAGNAAVPRRPARMLRVMSRSTRTTRRSTASSRASAGAASIGGALNRASVISFDSKQEFKAPSVAGLSLSAQRKLSVLGRMTSLGALMHGVKLCCARR
jgi:hypothetical protein